MNHHCFSANACDTIDGLTQVGTCELDNYAVTLANFVDRKIDGCESEESEGSEESEESESESEQEDDDDESDEADETGEPDETDERRPFPTPNQVY